MNAAELLELGIELENISDEQLTVHLAKYFPQTRPNSADLISEEPFELPEALKAALREAGQPLTASTHDEFTIE